MDTCTTKHKKTIPPKGNAHILIVLLVYLQRKNETNRACCRIQVTRVIICKQLIYNNTIKKTSYMPRYLIFLLCIAPGLNAQDVGTYLKNYATSQTADLNTEKEIIENAKPKALLKALAPFYSDSLSHVRQKAYYLTYKNATSPGGKNRAQASTRLIEGLNDPDAGTIGQNIGYLKQFHKTGFNQEGAGKLAALLNKKRLQHAKGIILLAGFVNTGSETLRQLYIGENTPDEIKFHAACALARMGDKEAVNYCYRQVSQMPLSQAKVDYIVPFAIYTRQEKLIAHCVEIINNNKKLCQPPNPEYSENIMCGYKVLELLAPAIENFPVQTGALGLIKGMGYEEALKTARKWFKENPTYTIRTDNY